MIYVFIFVKMQMFALLLQNLFNFFPRCTRSHGPRWKEKTAVGVRERRSNTSLVEEFNVECLRLFS